MRTGIFWSNRLRGKDWPIIGDKFHDIPYILKRLAKELGDRITIYESRPVSFVRATS